MVHFSENFLVSSPVSYLKIIVGIFEVYIYNEKVKLFSAIDSLYKILPIQQFRQFPNREYWVCYLMLK